MSLVARKWLHARCAVEHLYAPGQGALAIVCRAAAADEPIQAILRTLDHRTTSLVLAIRAPPLHSMLPVDSALASLLAAHAE
jgi:porphobilinogen deaminase